MDAIPLTPPRGAAATAVPPDVLASIEAVYERGLYLDAWNLAKPWGELRHWSGTEALVLGGRIAAQLGARRLGCRLHLKAFRQDPDSEDAWLWAMRALLARRGPYAAREAMRRQGRVIESVEALGLCAELAVHLRDLDEADRHLARALGREPENAWLHVVQAMAHRAADSYDAALAAATRALEVRPWFRPAVDARAEILIQLGRDEEALS